MKSILLPTDFSDNSINAIHYAVECFKETHCQFYIINIVKASSFVSDDLLTMQPSSTIYGSLLKASKSKITSLIQHLEHDYNNPKHAFFNHVDYDNFIEAISQIIKLKAIDLIVMGTKGASNVSQLLFGTHALRVIQRLNCPVLAIPENYAFKPVKRIVFTSSFKTKYATFNLKPLVELAKTHQAQIEVLHLMDANNDKPEHAYNKKVLADCLAEVKPNFIDRKGKDVVEMLNEFMDNTDVEMLCVVHKKHSFFERLFTKHHVENLAFKLKAPLLVLKSQNS